MSLLRDNVYKNTPNNSPQTTPKYSLQTTPKNSPNEFEEIPSPFATRSAPKPTTVFSTLLE